MIPGEFKAILHLAINLILKFTNCNESDAIPHSVTPPLSVW